MTFALWGSGAFAGGSEISTVHLGGRSVFRAPTCNNSTPFHIVGEGGGAFLPHGDFLSRGKQTHLQGVF